MVPLVVDGHLVPRRVEILAAPRRARFRVILEREEVAQGRRPQGSQDPRIGLGLPRQGVELRLDGFDDRAAARDERFHGVGDRGEIDDLVPGLVLSRPVVHEVGGRIVPSGQGLGERSVKDVAEVSGVRDRVVLDQAEKVGARRGHGTPDVVLR